MTYLAYGLVVVTGYLLGAIPVGLVVGKIAKGVDIRQYGSGKIGAANTLRTLGWGPTVLVFGGDLAKAIVAILLARWLIGEPAAEIGAGLAAVIGHNWSIYIKGQGGRGVTSAFGGALVFCPPAAAVGIAFVVPVVAWSRYVSLGSLTGAIVIPLATGLFVALRWVQPAYLFYMAAAAAIIIFQHRDNIQRLWTGTERRLGERVR